MPQTSAQVRTDLTSDALNPDRVIAQPQTGKGAHGDRVTINLVFDGVTFVPEDVFDALITLYGAGKVLGDRDVQAFGNYSWRIIP